MNIFELIKHQVEIINKSEKSIYLDSIIMHLERAELYYSSGEDDSNFYNDVIYRTNQAYEGAVKEAFNVLAEYTKEEKKKKTLFQIEKFFEEKKFFKDRVLELFRNYRSQWRNSSTHDYKLFFDNNEAFLAITSVSSFTYLLLNQIIEKLAYESELEKIRHSEKSIIELKKEGLQVARGILEIITLTLTDTIDFKNLNSKTLTESELIGFLKANISSFLPGSEITTDVKLKDNLRADFLIDFGGEKLILEIKKYSGKFHSEQFLTQIVTYLKGSELKEGIGLAINVNNPFEPLKIEEHKIEFEKESFSIRIISN